MGHFHQPSIEPVKATVLRERSEWIIHTKAARKMIETFPDMFTQIQKNKFFAKEEMAVISSIVDLARNAKKCKELNSVDYLCSPIRTLEGWMKVTYYHVGDVVFVTTPGRFDGQKYVSAIFSLTEKLGRIEEVRRSAETSGKRKIPLANLRRMRKHRKGRGYFENNN